VSEDWVVVRMRDADRGETLAKTVFRPVVSFVPILNKRSIPVSSFGRRTVCGAPAAPDANANR
jgi:hypothetical protein